MFWSILLPPSLQVTKPVVTLRMEATSTKLHCATSKMTASFICCGVNLKSHICTWLNSTYKFSFNLPSFLSFFCTITLCLFFLCKFLASFACLSLICFLPVYKKYILFHHNLYHIPSHSVISIEICCIFSHEIMTVHSISINKWTSPKLLTLSTSKLAKSSSQYCNRKTASVRKI
jgi:hypothetical protein